MSSTPWTRWLGPAALAVALLAVVAIVISSSAGGSDGGTEATSTPTGTQASRTDTTTAPRTTPAEEGARTTSTTSSDGPRTYTVRGGDNLGAIAERTGVPVDRLQELNPTVDPQALTVGQKLKLAE